MTSPEVDIFAAPDTLDAAQRAKLDEFRSNVWKLPDGKPYSVSDEESYLSSDWTARFVRI
jgi:hypothetical protein